MLKLLESEQQLSIIEIEDFELQKNITLPDGYKNFLLKNNGGFSENPIYIKSIQIDNFIPLKYGDYTIEENLETLKDVLPDDSIPFADTGEGVIFFKIAEEYNKIYVLYSDGEQRLISNSFKDFISQLKPNAEYK